MIMRSGALDMSTGEALNRERTMLLSFQSFDDFMIHQVADYHHNTDFRDCLRILPVG